MTEFEKQHIQNQLQIIEATGKALERVKDCMCWLQHDENLAQRAQGYLDILTQLTVAEAELMAGILIESPLAPDDLCAVEAPETAVDLQARLDQAVEMLRRFLNAGVVPTAELEACIAAVTDPPVKEQ